MPRLPTHSDRSPSHGRRRSRWLSRLGDVSGAFADLGTFLPLIIGMFAVARLDPSGVLIGFGLFALAVAVLYRRPVPVQPMKVVAALVIAGGLSAADVAASGILLAGVLLLLAAVGVIGHLGRLIPETVMLGIQLGVGLYLSWAGIQLLAADAWLGMVALGVLLVFQLSPWRPVAVPVVLLIGVGHAVLYGATPLPALSLGIHLPDWVWPGVDNFVTAARDVLLPQLALTLTNATLVTAAIAAERFPADRARITPKRLAVSTGGLNMLLAPLGAFPMCHGAGGLVVQYRFGARTGLAPAIFGGSCLVLGVFLGADGLALLQIIPLAVVGAMLAVAGADLALTRRLRSTSPDRMVLIGITGLTCLFGNVALGLLVGVILEFARARWFVGREP